MTRASKANELGTFYQGAYYAFDNELSGWNEIPSRALHVLLHPFPSLPPTLSSVRVRNPSSFPVKPTPTEKERKAGTKKKKKNGSGNRKTHCRGFDSFSDGS